MTKQDVETTAAELVSLPIQQMHAAVREFHAHTPGLRQLLAWLREHGVTTVALEATGAYGHVLFLTLLEAGFHVVTTAPTFTRQIKGRPKTDHRDCPWIQRLHRHGLLAERPARR